MQHLIESVAAQFADGRELTYLGRPPARGVVGHGYVSFVLFPALSRDRFPMNSRGAYRLS